GDHDVEREVQIAHHPADEHGLLKVLPAEHRDIGLDQMEELRYHREDPREVSRTNRAFEPERHWTRIHPDQRLPGIHRRAVGREETIDAPLSREGAVAIEVTRVAGEIFLGTE